MTKGVGKSTEWGGGEGEAEEAGEEKMASWVEAMGDCSDVRQKFAGYVEGA